MMMTGWFFNREICRLDTMAGNSLRLGLMLWLGLMSLGMTTAADARQGHVTSQDHQLSLPTKSQSVQKERNQVFTYDGLASSKEQRALDEQFERIENKTFSDFEDLPPHVAGMAEVDAVGNK